MAEAEERFAQLKLTNITTRVGDGTLGWPEQVPFERIIVPAAAVDVPPVLVAPLTVGGVLVVPVGDDDDDQRLVRVLRTEDGAETEDLNPVRFVPLVPGVASD